MNKRRIDVVTAGGLANRMRAIAAGITLAHKAEMDCRILWPVNTELKAEFDDLFDTASPDSHRLDIKMLYSPLERFSVLPPGKRNLHIPVLLQRSDYNLRLYDNVNLDRYSEYPEELLNLVRNSSVRSFKLPFSRPNSRLETKNPSGDERNVLIFSGLPFYPFDEELYRNLFRFSDIVKHRANEISNGEAVRYDYGMHIRQTDNYIAIANSPVQIFEQKIEELLKKDPDVRIYIASDSQDVKERLSKKFGSPVTCNSRPADRISREGMIDAAAEMLILSRTGRIYGSFWSSYSEAAAMIGNIPLEVLKY